MAGTTKWYVVHTYSGYENKVMDDIVKVVNNRNMQDEILDVRVPTETVTEVKEDGTQKEVVRKLFPGYVLVKVNVQEDGDDYKMSDNAWYIIRNTRGVTGFVGPESKPVPLSPDEVEKLGVDQKTVEINFNVGDFVKITDGPLKDFSGTVESINADEGIANVKVSMFGRETSVEVPVVQIETDLD